MTDLLDVHHPRELWKIIKCEFEYDGEKTWYDWND